MNRARIAVGLLSMSAAAFVALTAEEDYVGAAMIPTKGDRPTLGFGSTFHEDGTPVKMGDTTTPVRALIKAQAHVSREEVSFRKSLDGASLYPPEFDIYMNWVYQYGTGAWWKSSMRREILAGNYLAACDALLLYKFSAGFDCSTPGNKICGGVWTRQLKRHATCVGQL